MGLGSGEGGGMIAGCGVSRVEWWNDSCWRRFYYL